MKKKNIIHYDTERLNAVPLSEIVNWLDHTKRNGTTILTRCPWHEDHNPSLVIYERTGENRCHCFACGKGGSVVDYVMAHEGKSFKEACQILSDHLGIPYLSATDVADDINGKPPYRKTAYRPMKYSKPSPAALDDREQVQKPITFIPKDYVGKTISTGNSFSQCLAKLYDEYLADYLTEEYQLGAYESRWIENGTIFWTIDIDGNVRNGKVQCYETDVNSENFMHSDKTEGKTFWLGKQLSKLGVVRADAEFNVNRLFGEHLLNKYPDAVVMLVESPKNAIIGAAEYQKFLWLATGNKGAFKREVLSVLQNRDVLVIPDRDAIEEWKAKLPMLADIGNFAICELCEELSQNLTKTSPESNKKSDIADLIVASKLQKLIL